MHRHVRRIGDEASLTVEHRAGKVEPLLDVDRIGGVLQRHPHLLGDRHEEMIEDPSMTGSALAPIASRRAIGSTRVITTWFFAVISARQPCSTTIV